MSVYNLHLKGTIRFYTRGIDAVELIDKDGLVYLIGSQKAEELARVIQNKLKNSNEEKVISNIFYNSQCMSYQHKFYDPVSWDFTQQQLSDT